MRRTIRFSAAWPGTIGQGMNVTPLYPAETAGYFLTPEEARAHNTGMARWYFTVNAPSPSKPFAVATS